MSILPANILPTDGSEDSELAHTGRCPDPRSDRARSVPEYASEVLTQRLHGDDGGVRNTAGLRRRAVAVDGASRRSGQP